MCLEILLLTLSKYASSVQPYDCHDESTKNDADFCLQNKNAIMFIIYQA